MMENEGGGTKSSPALLRLFALFGKNGDFPLKRKRRIGNTKRMLFTDDSGAG
jgi:hypothetical protein